MKDRYTSFFQRGDKVYIRKHTEDGSRDNYSVAYKPKLYIETREPNCEFKTLDGTELKEIVFESIRNARGYVESYQGKVFGYPRWAYACVDDEFPYEIEYDFDSLRIAYLDIETKSDTHYSTVKNPDQPINLIQIWCKNVLYIFGTEFYESFDDDIKFIRCENEIDMLKKFVSLFRKLDPDIISGWNSQGYDIPMLYARMEKIELLDTFKRLSPFNMVDTSEVEVFQKMQLRVDIKGIQHLDMMELIKKFDTKKYENYKLDTVAKAILKRGKVAYKGKLSDLYITDYKKFVEYGIVDVQLLRDIESIKNLIRMVVSVSYMDKVNFIDAFSQVRSWDNQIMTYLKHNYNVQVPYNIPKDDDEFDENGDEKFEGAFVFEPVPDKYVWVMSDDVQSMHPSIIMSFNISPETYLGNSNKNVEYFLQECPRYTQELKDNNATSLANGAMFDNTYEGFLPKLVRRVFNMRVEAKDEAKRHKKLAEKIGEELKSNNTQDLRDKLQHHRDQAVNYNTLQNALKVKINSMFGFLGNKYSRFYQLDMAEGITLTSQVMLKSGADEIDKVLGEVLKSSVKSMIYGDTDSVYYSMAGLVDAFVPKNTPTEKTIEFLDRFHKKNIQPRLSQRMSEVQTRMNAREHSIRFVRDVISDIGIFIAKKKYIISVWDSEGVRYSSPDLKILGVESVKTSTPQYCRTKIEEAIKVILYSTETEFHSFIIKTEDEFNKLPVDAISSPRKVSDIDKYTENSEVYDMFSEEREMELSYKKGSPIQVKAAVFHNKLLMDKKLTDYLQPIENGDNIRFVYLKQPNPIRNNAIAFSDTLPPEFGLDRYIDYNLQWNKTFYSPVKAIADIINWDMQQNNAMF